MKKIFIIVFIILCSLIKIANAGDSLTFSISCIVPAIPGVNAPLIEEKTPEIQMNDAADREIKVQQESELATQELIQEDRETVQTVYSR